MCFYAYFIAGDCVSVSKSERGLESFRKFFAIRTHLLLLFIFHDLDNSFSCFVYCSNVFNEVQENSSQIWKYQHYYLVMEYSKQPPLAPPFAIICHIVEFVRWLRNVKNSVDNYGELMCFVLFCFFVYVSC